MHTLDDVTMLIHRSFYAFLALLEKRLAAAGLDDTIRPGMGPVLFALFENDGCIIRDLRQATGLSPSTLSTTLARAEKAGLLARRVDQGDARATRIHLTKKAWRLRPRLQRFHADLVATVCADLGEREAEALRRHLATALSSINRAL